MIDTLLEVLYQVEEGDTDPDEIAAHAGLSEAQLYQLLTGMRTHGLLMPSAPDDPRPHATGLVVSPTGRNLLLQGAEEVFKKTWSERLGGEDDSAS